MHYPKISLLVLTWNEKDILAGCLKSIKAIEYPNYDVVVIDNGSTDGTAIMVNEAFPWAELVRIDKNVGPTEGANCGIRHALKSDAKYIFFTTNDTVLDKDILLRLVEVAESDEKIGIVGPTTYCMEKPQEIQCAGGFINWKNGTISHAVTQKFITEVDYLGFIMIRSRILDEIGLYNSKYFAYWEDTDLCTRVKRAGYKVLCIPKAKIWHIGSHTTRKSSGFFIYQLTRNNFWFMKLHASKRNYLTFLLYNFLFRFWFLTGVYLIKYRDTERLASFYRGLLDGIIKNP